MTTLVYRSHAMIEDLEVGECTMHRASGAEAGRWWQLWFRVQRDTDGQADTFCVPMNPGGPLIAQGPGGRTWGLLKRCIGQWQVTPSINVLASGDAHHGPSADGSIWHQTPTIVGVPEDEPWARGAAP